MDAAAHDSEAQKTRSACALYDWHIAFRILYVKEPVGQEPATGTTPDAISDAISHMRKMLRPTRRLEKIIIND